MNEIFVDITNDILENVIPNYYRISNYGTIIKNNGKRIGSFSKKYNMYKCNLNLVTGKQYFYIDIATLEYCAFHNIKYTGELRIKFKDKDVTNLRLDNLYNVADLIVPDGVAVNNSLISSADYHIKNMRSMCYYVDELWMNITNKEIPNILPIYMISNHGRVYNKIYGDLVSTQISFNGYINSIVKLQDGSYTNMSIHRTMMKCFKPIPDWSEMEVNHIDHNSFNNELYNLEWVTHEENMKLRELYSQSIRLTDDDIYRICAALEKGMSYIEIACYVLHRKYTGILHSQICNIHRRVSHSNISNSFEF